MDTRTAFAIEDRFADVGGLKLRYIETGEGVPVLLLHGASLGSSADVYLGTLGAFAEVGFRAIAFDQPGFGLSDNPADFSVAHRRDSILGIMDALKIERAALIAHSQAGNMGFVLAEKHPRRISRLVALGTGSLLPPLPESEKPAKRPAGPAEGREGTQTEPTPEDTRKLLEANLYRTELITGEALALRHKRSVGKNFEAFLARQKLPSTDIPDSDRDPPLWQRIANPPVPIRLIYGRQDRGYAVRRAALLRERHPDIDLHIIDGCKHLVPWDAAEDYVRLSVEFLKE